jgi:phage head maturation protease
MSFGFFVPPGGDAWHREGARTIRTLKKVELFEVSLVALPAYPQTIVMLRIALDTMLAAVLVARRRRLEALVV